MNLHDYSEKKHISTRRLLDFTLCTNPLGPSNKARTAMRKIVREVGTFPDDETRYLRRFLSRKEGVPEESFLFGHGSSHLLSLYLQVFKPSTISLPWPYARHRALLLKQLGVTCAPLPLVTGEDGFALDPEQLLSHASQGKTLLLTHPHDPTGAIAPTEMIHNLIEAVEQSGGMLIVDEAFIEYTDVLSAARQATQSSHCLVLRTFSLFHALAGLRIGYGVGHPSLIARLSSSLAPGSVNCIALTAARASVADKSYYRRTSEYVAAEKAYVRDKLQRLAGLIVRDTSCNFVLIRLEKEIPDIAELFLKRSMFVETFKDAEGKVWMRLPMRRRPQNARFVKTLRYLVSLSETG